MITFVFICVDGTQKFVIHLWTKKEFIFFPFRGLGIGHFGLVANETGPNKATATLREIILLQFSLWGRGWSKNHSITALSAGSGMPAGGFDYGRWQTQGFGGGRMNKQ